MKLTDMTTLARSIDPRYPTNLAIVGLGLLAGAVGAAWRWSAGETPSAALAWGASAGLALFLAWALARELDPDHDLSAFVAAGLALAGLPFLDLPEFLPLLWLLLALRLVVRTTGLPARLPDSLAVLGLGLWLAWQGEWGYGLLTAAALFLDGWLPPRLRWHLPLAALALLLTLGLVAWQGLGPRGAWGEGPLLWLRGAVLLIFGLHILVAKDPTAVGDRTGERLRPERLRGGQVLALLTAVLVAGWLGQTSVAGLLPLWAAMLGVSLYGLGLAIAHLTGKPEHPGRR